MIDDALITVVIDDPTPSPPKARSSITTVMRASSIMPHPGEKKCFLQWEKVARQFTMGPGVKREDLL
jgi:hypothetical protein